MGKSAIDANVNNEIFRNDAVNVIAMRRELASILPVRLKYESAGYKAGQVLAKNTSTGLFEKFSGASGTYAAQAVLFENVRDSDQPATGGALARGIVAGYLFKDALTDYDSTVKSQLGAHEISDATGVDIVKF